MPKAIAVLQAWLGNLRICIWLAIFSPLQHPMVTPDRSYRVGETGLPSKGGDGTAFALRDALVKHGYTVFLVGDLVVSTQRRIPTTSRPPLETLLPTFFTRTAGC